MTNVSPEQGDGFDPWKKITDGIKHLHDGPEDQYYSALSTLGDLMMEAGALRKDLDEQSTSSIGNLRASLRGSPADRFRKSSEEALRNGGVERWPEISNLSPKIAGTRIEMSDKEKLPRTNEEKFAYMLYRKGGINPAAALTFATKGFVFNNMGQSPYIPVSTAVQVLELVSGIIGENDYIVDSEEEALEIFLDENAFGVKNINPSTQILIEPEDLNSLENNAGVFRGLPEVRKKEILKDYLEQGERAFREYCEYAR